MSVADNLRQVLADLPQGVRLVAVSKFHPEEAILEAYGAGQRIFGESKVQEMSRKHEALPKDIEWHFIGHLQTNKVKYIAPYVALIHGIDSFRLLAEVEKQGAKAGRMIDVLLQIHIAREETKFGFSPDECRGMLAEGAWKGLSHVRIRGLMGMASNTDDMEQVRREFESLHALSRRDKGIILRRCPVVRPTVHGDVPRLSPGRPRGQHAGQGGHQDIRRAGLWAKKLTERTLRAGDFHNRKIIRMFAPGNH